MFYLTGDTHGSFERINEFCHRFKTTKEDVMIILGDAGINYYEGKRAETLKNILDDIPITFFVFMGTMSRDPMRFPVITKKYGMAALYM